MDQSPLQNRRRALSKMGGALGLTGMASLSLLSPFSALASPAPRTPLARRSPVAKDERTQQSIDRGLKYLASQQSRLGLWPHNTYPTAMTALAGLALICSGNTTIQGPYRKNVQGAVDYLLSQCRDNGLIGDPRRDNRYTYGHGFAMLFLSQVLGEEEDTERRDELAKVLTRSVEFSISAQTRAGGWGYVSGRDSDFDEGSTTITQVQGLRGCRNAGIPVPAKPIEDAKGYIYTCKNKDGGISYSSKSRGSSRPAITAAALAALYNAGDYESEHIPEMWAYCKKNLHQLGGQNYGHWHYTYLYYSQVVYRQPADVWEPWREKLCNTIIGDQLASGGWDGRIAPVYSTSCNLIMMQIDNGFLPIFQR